MYICVSIYVCLHARILMYVYACMSIYDYVVYFIDLYIYIYIYIKISVFECLYEGYNYVYIGH